MCQLLCGIHSLFQVDNFNLSTFVPYSDTLWWNAWLIHCELPFCHTTLMMQQSMTRGHHSFRTPIVICELYGTILRYLPWNVCIKMYLRIGEAKNPGPTSKPQPKSQPKQPDPNRELFQTVQFATANVVSMVDKAPWFNSFDHE